MLTPVYTLSFTNMSGDVLHRPHYWSRGDLRPVEKVIWMNFKDIPVAVAERIGSGTFGRVYAICQSSDSSCTMRGEFGWAMKLQLLEKNNDVTDHFLVEVDRNRRAATLGVGVQMHDWDIVTVDSLPLPLQNFGRPVKPKTLVGIMIQDRWMSDLGKVRQDWVFASKARIIRRLEELISVMHANNTIHADLMPKNVLVRFSPLGEFEDLTLADFGFAFPASRLWQEIPGWTSERLAYYFDGSNITTARLPNTYLPLVITAQKIHNKEPTADPSLIADWTLQNPFALDKLILYHYANWR